MSTMKKTLILQICFAIFCFQGVYCRLSVGNIFPPSNFFRQTADEECINEQIDEHFDNDIEFIDCVNMLTDFDDSDNQTDQEQLDQIINYFEVLCTTECGDFYFEVAEECEFEYSSKIVDTLQPLCETNSNGDVCYELFTTYLSYAEVETSCTLDYLSNSGTCTCESDLEDAVEDLGCCVSVYHQFVDGDSQGSPNQIAEEFSGGSVNTQDIYDECGVDLPAACSTVSHHVYISMILFAMVVTALMMA